MKSSTLKSKSPLISRESSRSNNKVSSKRRKRLSKISFHKPEALIDAFNALQSTEKPVLHKSIEAQVLAAVEGDFTLENEIDEFDVTQEKTGMQMEIIEQMRVGRYQQYL